jgi:ribosomal protein L37AE/L43A
MAFHVGVSHSVCGGVDVRRLPAYLWWSLLAAMVSLTMRPGVRYTDSLRWDILRGLIRKRDGYQCRVCDSKAVYGRNWLEVHHRRSLSRGGSYYPTNLVLVCKPCHDTLHS